MDLSKCQCEKAGFCPAFNKNMSNKNWQWCKNASAEERKRLDQKYNNWIRIITNEEQDLKINNKKISVHTYCDKSSLEKYEQSYKYLSNYYDKYDIKTYMADENDKYISECIDIFRKAGISNWSAAVTSRFVMMKQFLESDSEYFILQDLDYLVINKNINIRKSLPSCIAPFWKLKIDFVKSNKYNFTEEKQLHILRKVNIQKSIIKDSHLRLPQSQKNVAEVCADFIGLDRNNVTSIVEFYKSLGCDIFNLKSFTSYVIEKLEESNVINKTPDNIDVQEEDFYSTYLFLTENHREVAPINSYPIRQNCWNIDNTRWGEKSNSTGWFSLAKVTKQRNYIFAHLGCCAKNTFKNLVELYPC